MYDLKDLTSGEPKLQIKEECLKENHLESLLNILDKKSTHDNKTKPTNEISEADAVDFFIKIWDDEPDTEPSLAAEGGLETSEETLADDADSVGLIRRELQERFSGMEITKQERASYMPFHIKVEKEKNSFFHPSYKPVPIKQKIPDGKEPRNIADEGFFVGKKPFVSKRNINRLESRLVQQKELHWFGEDGKVKMLSDPVCNEPYRQILEDNPEEFPALEYVKASVKSNKLRLNVDKDKQYQLDLDLSSISFVHHPLFSAEHVIESRLLQMYEKYYCNEKKDLVNNLQQKLKALRAAVSNIKKSMRVGMQETSVNNERLTRLKQYSNDIRQTKRMRDWKESEQKILWKDIIDTWEELKKRRQTQGFTSTSFNLKIHRERTDEAIEKEEWERELLDELEEEMEEYESCSEKLFQEYETALNKWKQWNKAQKLAKKRQKIREKLLKKTQDEESDIPEDLNATKLEDEKILAEPELPKPKPVSKFNSAATLEKLRNNAIKMRRNPGDPKLHITVDHDIPITPSSQCPREEVYRRNAVSKTKLYFKIMYNNKKVAETCERSLSQDFKAVWGQIFKIQIVQYPQSLQIEILESGFFSGYHFAELFIPVPNVSQTALNSKLIDHQFSSDKYVSPKYASVGSGVSFKFHNGTETFLLSSGVLKCSLVWGVSDDGAVLVPPFLESPLKDARVGPSLSYLTSGRFFSIAKLLRWIKNSNLDPHNPENFELFQIFQDLGVSDTISEESTDYFRLDPFQDELDFCTSEEIENNKRFQLLQLRNQDASFFRNLTMIPSDEKDLSEEMLQVREEVAKRFYVSQHQKMFEDIVIEEKVPSIGMIGFSLLKLFQTKRPLYPARKDRKKINLASTNMDVKIIFRILHASNVPVRKDVQPVKEKTEKNDFETSIQFESQVQPFVEVMFQRTAVKTGIADGPHPTWNQEIELPFCAPNNNYSPASLETVKDVIYINLFDEVTVDLLDDDVERGTVVYERLERRWLGNLKVPFTTLYLNSKIEGTFRINVPPVLLSYENEPRPWLSGLSGVSEGHTYLSFFMTIEPCLPLPEIFRDQCDSGEPEKVLYEVEKWRQSVIPRYPDRIIKLMSVDLSGKWIFITRFLRPLEPPEELLFGNKESVETMELLARFVSLIPTVSDSIAFPGLCDIWSTSDQFLQMLCGDEEEHAILLCNYFLHLGKRAMLLLGLGIPEGPTAYVVTWQSSNDVWVWNASTGDHFSVQDNHNPLQSVGCLISVDNVWANIQRSNHPSRINFDVTKMSDWKPFFSRSLHNPGLRSIQPSVLRYSKTDPKYVQELQESLASGLQNSIIKWRHKIPTSWNEDCNKVLYKILTRLERNAGRTASDDSLQELEQILSAYKMNGFPLTMPYTENEAVIEAVFATGVHLTEDKNAEFSLAVYIHPYPCSILAIWVYVAVLIQRRHVKETEEDE
ncbi:LOW QUALITY PROTEIN: coiled-coil and C2 domain-containing protein 2A-like [Uloborus diversus]|uniref:LOW QUALITY PROTEIN: coiled-coil and C2 domain-containing protein 2A-like n=1 Tax=Uloborus diversus TaxID=327109 RepID=UPI00240934CD|nr:LOW QUALITY PROTEIN: coiled-coil and C2 domain-containing protein 2A-like [Uloborus diversus]